MYHSLDARSLIDEDGLNGGVLVAGDRRVVDDGDAKPVVHCPVVGAVGGAAFIGQAGYPSCLWRVYLFGLAQFLFHIRHRIDCGETQRQFTCIRGKAFGTTHPQIDDPHSLIGIRP